MGPRQHLVDDRLHQVPTSQPRGGAAPAEPQPWLGALEAGRALLRSSIRFASTRIGTWCRRAAPELIPPNASWDAGASKSPDAAEVKLCRALRATPHEGRPHCTRTHRRGEPFRRSSAQSFDAPVTGVWVANSGSRRPSAVWRRSGLVAPELRHQHYAGAPDREFGCAGGRLTTRVPGADVP